MAWIRIDGQLHSHPKFLAAWRQEPAAVGLELMALSWAGEHLTDGKVSNDFVGSLFANDTRRRRRAVSALVSTGLWIPNGNDGWAIHDYLDVNESRAEILKRRKAREARRQANRRLLDAGR